MLTRLIQRTDSVSEGSIEYEYEYRDAEYEKKNEQSIEPKFSIARSDMVTFSPRTRSMRATMKFMFC